MRSSRRDYPDCPECETDVFVGRDSGTSDYRCHSCGATFDAEQAGMDGCQPEWVIER